MATKIVTKNSSTASAVPTAAQLVQGELAVNVADKRLYTEDNAGAVVELGTNPSSLTVSGNIDVDGVTNLDAVDIDGAVDMASSLTVTGEITANGGIALGDNDKATFGAGDDLQIYHDGTDSYISEVGAGGLVVQARDAITFEDGTSGDNYLYMQRNSKVELYHAGSAKLATTSTGIDVTGTATMDGLSVQSTSASATVASFKGSSAFGIELAASAVAPYIQTVGVGSGEELAITSGGNKVALFQDGGDISFYEDTGTTPKFFWDASAESLRVPISLYDNSINAFPSEGYASIYSTGAGGSAPFNEAGHLVLQARSSGALRDILFATGNGAAERMRIDSSGNVGIGTSSPQKIHGGASLDGETSTGFEFIAGNSTVSTVGGEFLGGYAFRNNDSSGTPDHYSGIKAVASDSFGSANLEFYSGRDRYEAGTAPNMIILGSTASTDGFVGIGTSSPASTLEIAKNDQTNGATLSITNSFDGGDWNAGDTVGSIDFRTDDFSSAEKVRGQIKVFDDSASGSTYPFANAMSFSTGYFATLNERMRIDSSGNVGIGTSSPSSTLHLKDTRATLRLESESVGGTTFDIRNGVSGGGEGGISFRDITNSATRMTISSAGNVGIGTISSIDQKLTLADTSDVGIKMLKTGSGTGTIRAVGGGMAFGYDGGSGTTERMRIDSSGNLLVGTTSVQGAGGVTLSGAGYVYSSRPSSTAIYADRTGSDGAIQEFRKNGTTVGSISVTGSATSYNTSSDQRLKDNIADADDAGSKIDAIQVRKYDWKADGEHQKYGMIAQELQAVAPEAVSGDADSEEMMGVDYSKLVPMLIKEIQSLRNRVAQLETGE
ncbi:tail fiber domain-containing protein [bacterium]|nr:tail fiber domain-containing protein [bacterium]